MFFILYNKNIFHMKILKYMQKFWQCFVVPVEALRPDDPSSCQVDARFQPR